MKTHLVLVLVSLFVISCGSRKDGESCHLDGNCESGGASTNNQSSGSSSSGSSSSGSSTVSTDLSCTVTPDKTRVVGFYKVNGTAVGGEKLGLAITAKGGTGSYAVPSFVSSFSSSTTIFGYYENSGSSDIAITRTVKVTDTSGAVASCSFNVTVAPAARPTGSLACTITPSNYNPQVGETVTFTINAWNYTPTSYSYNFGQFLPRQGEPPKALNTVSGGTAVVTHAYNATWIGRPDLASLRGPADPAVLVTNGADSVWCQLPYRFMWISPAVPASLNADWTRDASDYDNLINVDLSALDFGAGSPITYSASILSSSVGSSAGISIAQNNNDTGSDLFTVRRTDTVPHAFVVRFTATNGTKTATKDVSLTFATSIDCTMIKPLTIYAGVEADFAISGTHGELIDIYDLSVDGTSTSSRVSGASVAHAKVTFANSGYYGVRIRASKTGSSPTLFCNNGTTFTSYVYVNPAPSTLTGCDVKTSVTRTKINAPVRIDVVKKGGGVDMGGYLVTINPNGTTPYSRTTLLRNAYISGIDTSSIELMWLDAAESLSITASIRELSSGRTFSCQTYVSIEPNLQGLLVNVFRLGSHQLSPLTTHQRDLYLSSFYSVNQSSFRAANIDVSPRRSDCDDRKHSHRKYSDECEYPGVSNNLKEWFLVEYTGRIYIPASYSGSSGGDLYQFKFQVDDGVMLYVDEDFNSPVVAFDGLHSPTWSSTGSKYLTPGYHNIRVRYFQGPNWQIANQFYWKNASIPGSGFTIVPASSLYQ